MFSLSFQTFLSFYNTNVNKIFLPTSGDRGINYEHIDIWYENIQQYSPEDIKDVYMSFAKTFTDILLYVDFSTFLNKIEEITHDINNIIGNNEQYDKIYFYIPDEITKSNFWITLLVFHFFIQTRFNISPRSHSPSSSRSRSPSRPRSRSPSSSRSRSPSRPRSRSRSSESSLKHKIQFTYSFDWILKNCYNNGEPQKTLCIYCDDMPYTGNQLINNIKIPKKYTAVEKDVIMENINVVIGCPYISNNAKIKLDAMSYVTLCGNSQIVNTYIDELKIRYMDSEPEMVNNIIEMFDFKSKKYTLGRSACDCSRNYTAIYFDHKLADELSTFKKLILTGSYPVDDETNCKITPLIHGCTKEEIITSAPGYKCNRGYTFDEELACYTPFYKTIVYNVRNVRRSIINVKRPKTYKVKNITLLALMNAGGGKLRCTKRR